MKYTLIFAIVLLLSGCSQMKFVHPTKGTSNLNYDYNHCDYEALRSTVNIRSPFEGAYRHVEIRNKCMMIKGYRLVSDG